MMEQGMTCPLPSGIGAMSSQVVVYEAKVYAFKLFLWGLFLLFCREPERGPSNH
jgi:hypothetical protein